MSKHTKHRRDHAKRHATARMIRAAASWSEPIWCENADIEWIKAVEAGEAKPKRFTMTAYTGGPMLVNSYGPPVVIDLAGLRATAPVPILRDHDLSRVVGHADEIKVGDSSIKLTGLISGAGSDAAEVVAAAANGFPWKASVGARPDKMEFVGEGVQTKVNGKTFTGPLYVARKSTLGETSFVAVGADRKANAKVAASAAQTKTKEASAMKFEQWIEAMGLSLEELREDQTIKLQAKYDAEVKVVEEKSAEIEAAKIEAAKAGKPGDIEGSEKPPVVEALKFDLPSVELEYARHETAIKATAVEYRTKVSEAEYDKLYDAAIKGGLEAKATALKDEWPAARLEAEYIKAKALFTADLMVAERPKGPGTHSSSQDVSMPAIEAAFCQSAGLSEPEKHFTPEVLEASDKYRGIGIQQLLLICASQNGYSGRQWIRGDNLRKVIQAAFSTHTITTMLTTTGNKLLLDGFNLLPQSWRQVASVKSVSDFKAVTMYRMNADLAYEEVGPGGEIEHGTVSQEDYNIQAKTYAKMIALTRQDIINDDLGAFNDLRNRLGMGAAVKLNDIFWTAWLAAVDGGAFWTSGRGNRQAGATTALGEVGLNKAVKLFRDAKGPDGNRLGLEPAILLSGSDLEATNRKLFTSMEVRDSTDSGSTLVANIHFNRFKPIIIPELSDTALTGGSTTQWFLLANPAVLASAAMCFLDGQQSPTIETTDADFNTLGIQSRGYHDFGVAMTEFRASVLSVGV
jgi:phage major head subunit gpT-like protein